MPTQPPAMAYAPSDTRPRTRKTAPRVATLKAGLVVFESTNCGTKDRKKIAVFGLRMLRTMPSTKIRWYVRCSTTPPVKAVDPRRYDWIDWMPSQIRYAAPTSFTMVKAVADAARIAYSPIMAANTCTTVPRWIPATETSPALRPCAALRVTMYITAGPGMMSKTNATAENASKVLNESIQGHYPPLSDGRGEYHSERHCRSGRAVRHRYTLDGFHLPSLAVTPYALDPDSPLYGTEIPSGLFNSFEQWQFVTGRTSRKRPRTATNVRSSTFATAPHSAQGLVGSVAIRQTATSVDA